MKTEFAKIPVPLQKEIRLRIAGAGFGLAMVILEFFCHADWRYFIPCLLLISLCAYSATALYYRCVHERYIVITGVCAEIEKGMIRKQTKAIYLRQDDICIKLIGAPRLKHLMVGDRLTLYLADNAMIYELDDCYVVYDILALQHLGTKD